jgi:hypothetical protein
MRPSAGAKPPAVAAKRRVDNALADSDAQLKYRLSLPFVVAPGLDKCNTTENSGNGVNLVAILLGAVLAMTVLW